MLLQFLKRYADSDAVALIDADGAITWRQLCDESKRLAKQLAASIGRGQRVGLPLQSSIRGFVQLAALVECETHLFLVSSRAKPSQLCEWSHTFGWQGWLAADGTFQLVDTCSDQAVQPAILGDDRRAQSTGDESTYVTILTSGTTGKPKAVRHTWQSLARPARISDQLRETRWLMTYRPHLYAGMQVVLQAFANGGTLVLPASGATADEVVRLAIEGQVEYASATPSYWRWLLTLADTEALAAIPLRQITLGGEAVDQNVLDTLQHVFPSTRVVHIYATTELGRCFSVTDGRAGFPANYLNQISLDGVQLRVVDNELLVRSANAMLGYDERNDASNDSCDVSSNNNSDVVRGGSAPAEPGAVTAEWPVNRQRPTAEDWFATGDLVRVESERVYFSGRKSDMINVGGNKVHPVEVEAVIREVPGVAEVRVFAQPSSLVGQLVACEIVLQPAAEADLVRKVIQQTCLNRLAAPQRPRVISFVPQLTLTEAGKTSRQ